MDVLDELQLYYAHFGELDMDEREMRFQKLSYQAQDFAKKFESLMEMRISLDDIIAKLGQKFPEKNISMLYNTYLKATSYMAEDVVIDAAFEQKTEYLVKMIERERLRNHFRKMAKKDEGQLANRMLANIDNKEMQMPKLHSLSDLSEPEVFLKSEKKENPLKSIWIYIGLLVLAFILIYLLFK